MRVLAITNKDPRFYPLLGPFLASRSVYRELRLLLWNDDNKQWWLAVDGDDRVLGFCAAVVRGAVATLCSAYVIPKKRRQGVYRDLFAARLHYLRGCGVRTVRATCTELSRPHLLAEGFSAVGKSGRYTKMERSL